MPRKASNQMPPVADRERIARNANLSLRSVEKCYKSPLSVEIDTLLAVQRAADWYGYDGPIRSSLAARIYYHLTS